MGIKLEAGKRYVKRNGDITGVLRDNPISHYYPFTDGDISWTSGGLEWVGGGSDLDIISEYVEPKPKFIHDEFVRGWLDGKTIQCQIYDDGEWVDLPIVDESEHIPFFTTEVKCRFKPKLVERREEVTVYLSEKDGELVISQYPGFLEGVQVLATKKVTFEWTEEEQ